MKKAVVVCSMVGAMVCASVPGLADTVSVSVDAKAAIFDAGQAGQSIGFALPTSVSLGSGTNRIATFSDVSGLVDCVQIGSPRIGPDGGNCTGSAGTMIFSANGISGIVDDSRQMFLTGVFIGPSTPSDPAPASLNFIGVNGHSFTDLYPVLNQEFFIGDGLTGTGSGSQQLFHVPDGATRLFLGFADAFGFGTPWNNLVGYPPSSYLDNSGSINAKVSITAATTDPVPEPATMLLFGTGLAGLAAVGRRKS